MKQSFFLLILFFSIYQSQAQITFRTEYLGNSRYKLSQDDKSVPVGNSSGSVVVYEGGINIPLKVAENEDGQSHLWMVSASGALAKLNNKNFAPGLVIDDILNVNLNLIHRAPISEKWFYLAVAGVGVYAPTIRLSDIESRSILGNAGVIFIRTQTPNLEWGVGAALNNAFGYPMIFPALYFDWKTDDKFAIHVQAIDGVETSVNYELTDYLTLGLQAEIKGQMTLLKQNDRSKMFTNQYITTAFSPEFKLGNKISIPIAAGIQAYCNAQLSNRNIKSLFQSEDYYFDLALYLSAGVKIDF